MTQLTSQRNLLKLNDSFLVT
ncbi:MAG: hypothetical protein QOD03_899, partial [Verrucomicrobiota bacterium]